MKKLPIDGAIAALPVVDEDELNDWLATEVETGGFSASLNISEWVDGQPKKITITLAYKTGDGTDQPYGDEPPDDAIGADLEGAGWSVETEGVMLYGTFCSKCAKNLSREELSCEARCPICKNEIQEVRGAKWIYGHRTINLKGDEMETQIKEQIENSISELV